MLSYVQEGSADIWKENIFGEAGERGIGIQICERVFGSHQKEFGGEEKKLVKVAEFKRLEQGGRIIEEFVKEFRRIAKE